LFLIYLPDGTNGCGARGGEFDGSESVYKGLKHSKHLKVVPSCS